MSEKTNYSNYCLDCELQQQSSNEDSNRRIVPLKEKVKLNKYVNQKPTMKSSRSRTLRQIRLTFWKLVKTFYRRKLIFNNKDLQFYEWEFTDYLTHKNQSLLKILKIIAFYHLSLFFNYVIQLLIFQGILTRLFKAAHLWIDNNTNNHIYIYVLS